MDSGGLAHVVTQVEPVDIFLCTNTELSAYCGGKPEARHHLLTINDAAVGLAQWQHSMTQ